MDAVDKEGGREGGVFVVVVVVVVVAMGKVGSWKGATVSQHKSMAKTT